MHKLVWVWSLGLLLFTSSCGKSGNNDTGTTPPVVPADTADKFPRVSDSVLLDLVQKQTLRYFTDFAHPVAAMARERNSSGDIVTTGGTGFGVMAIVSGVYRNYLSRTDAVSQLNKMTDFLLQKASRYHGAFPHWINGTTGATVPFSDADNGADLVETSFLLEGLLTARQYFDGTNAAETDLRDKINTIWNGVDWKWFQQGGKHTLYWHWSPDQGWAMNMPIKGWNEALIIYVLAASAQDPIDKAVYDSGWAQNGAMKNGNSYYGVTLPLGPALGGPLFFSHYSFLGLNPQGLSDSYADYWTQNTAHVQINYNYCVANPKSYKGYSADCWGLTSSDIKDGYTANAPDNDNGTISPTAAVSSLPYSPEASLRAIRYFYYKIGDKLWGDYGFKDAFNLSQGWYADSYLAIDQGPQVAMIENYRTHLLWNLFMSCPEIRNGLTRLGFK